MCSEQEVQKFNVGDRIKVTAPELRSTGQEGEVTMNLGPEPAQRQGQDGDALFITLDSGRLAAVTSTQVEPINAEQPAVPAAA